MEFERNSGAISPSHSFSGRREAWLPAKYPPKPAKKAVTTTINNSDEVFQERDRQLSSSLFSSSPISAYPVFLNDEKEIMFWKELAWHGFPQDENGFLGSMKRCLERLSAKIFKFLWNDHLLCWIPENKADFEFSGSAPNLPLDMVWCCVSQSRHILDILCITHQSPT